MTNIEKLIKSKKYSKRERKALRRGIIDLGKRGFKANDITKELNLQGYSKPDGTALTTSFINSQMHAAKISLVALRKGKRKYTRRVASQTQTVPISNKDQTEIITLLLSAQIPDGKKIAALKALL